MVERIGIMGGTFDPPHFGHLAIANAATEALELTEVRFVVANDPWQKSGDQRVTTAKIRLKMVQALVGEAEKFVVSDSEIRRGGPSYTIDTVEELYEESMEKIEISLILGADAAGGLGSWYRAEELREMVQIVVADRAWSDRDVPKGWRFQRLEMESIDISSSTIRERVRERKMIRDLVGEPVNSFIENSGLYR
ncbi:MAG: nicotinate-nucleotide adenylyltransferase [Actinomycetota bacterium]|nr:nicotinate-nucleotide adenylyltransferase [Acidimicrobiales bacterium]